jgi:hypothetical protein
MAVLSIWNRKQSEPQPQGSDEDCKEPGGGWRSSAGAFFDNEIIGQIQVAQT